MNSHFSPPHTNTSLISFSFNLSSNSIKGIRLGYVVDEHIPMPNLEAHKVKKLK
jgi:hypothetical protein